MRTKPTVPIYLMLGLLESGKTSVIRDFLDSNDFDDRSRNLIILSEEGEEELEDELLQRSYAKVITVEDASVLTRKYFQAVQKDYRPTAVIIELNGMTKVDEFMNTPLPDEWFLFQTIGLVNAETFEFFQKNMKDRFMDVFRYSDIIIFNRCDLKTRQQDIRRNVRLVNKKAQVMFESELEEFVEEEPELPFSLDADPIVVDFDDYGTWYVNFQDHPELYQGKRIKIDGYICAGRKDGHLLQMFGRVGMACCAEDMMFLGLTGRGDVFRGRGEKGKERTWGTVIGILSAKLSPYGELEDMLIDVESFVPKKEPKDDIVYFN